jgi:Pyruvate/2-oxoacid:ferredoxin oxidoreductase delta subunit
MAKRRAEISQSDCVACGACIKVCPRKAIIIRRGMFAQVDVTKCIGCGLCAKECPASIITMMTAEVCAG